MLLHVCIVEQLAIGLSLFQGISWHQSDCRALSTTPQECETKTTVTLDSARYAVKPQKHVLSSGQGLRYIDPGHECQYSRYSGDHLLRATLVL